MDLIGCHVLTDEVGIMVEESAVVTHSAWVSRAIDRCLGHDLQFVLLTPRHSRLTLGMTRVLELTGSQWVVSDDSGEYYAGMTGQRMEWTGTRFEPTLEMGEQFLNLPPSEVSGLLFTAEALQPARAATTVGRLAEELAVLVTGEPPHGWGTLEPVSEPWDVQAVTAHVRDQVMPRTAIVHAIGHHGADSFTTVTSVMRTEQGIVERVLAQWPDARPWDDARRDAFAEQMHASGVRFATVHRIERGVGLFRAPRFPRTATPIAACFGPQLVRERTVPAVLDQLGAAARAVGQGRWQSVALGYPDPPVEGSPHPAEELGRTMQWLEGHEPSA